ncbi:MAG TPA: NAD-dependent epimerase/dehydratase family protein [Polyangiaceae bacterium]|nr:NAD-dependent epimerase/dehydratase family protein [Polyangiaceae bacterium]
MRVLVTGGAGFIGSHVVDALLQGGHQVAVLDNLSTGKREHVPNGVQLFEADLRNAEATRRVLADFSPDAVSHQAAQASVAVSVRDPRLDAEINVMGGIHLLDACVASGVKKLVFASTGGAIYGEIPEGTRADESFAAAPLSPYAISKYSFELLLAVYRQHHGLASSTLRYANVYGPRQDPYGEAGVVAVFTNTARAGGTLRVNARRVQGDSGCVRDYVYVGDVARANVRALQGELAPVVLNIASGTGVTTEELARTILERVGNGGADLDSGPPRAGDLERSVLDATLAHSLLGPFVGLSEGLTRTIDYQRSRA